MWQVPDEKRPGHMRDLTPRDWRILHDASKSDTPEAEVYALLILANL